MDPPNLYAYKAPFLPTVKVKPLYNVRNKKQKGDKFCALRSKLKITQQEINIPDLIDEYYKRFKIDKHKTQPLSVSINFKQISQAQLQVQMAKYKQSKLRAKSQKNKNRSNSEGSYTHQLKIKKTLETEKIKLTSKSILNRFQGICRMGNFSDQLKIKYDIQEKISSDTLNSSQVLKSKTIQASESAYIGKIPKREEQEDFGLKQFSTLCSIAYRKRMKMQQKTMQGLKQTMMQPLPSPWKQSVHSFQNPEQNQQLFSRSIEY